MYQDLEEKGPKKIYKLAKTRQRRSRDIEQLIFVKDCEGKIVAEESKIKDRWKEYFASLLNTKNKRKQISELPPVQGPVEKITEGEVKSQLEKMATNKARGPNDLPVEVIKMLKETGINWMMACLNDIMKTGIPQEWRRSKITPIFKHKSDPLNGGNYRGIKLLSHSSCMRG